MNRWQHLSFCQIGNRTRCCLFAALGRILSVRSNHLLVFYLTTFKSIYSVFDARKFSSIEMAAKVASNGKGFQPVSNCLLIPHAHSSCNSMRKSSLWAIDCDHNLILSFHCSSSHLGYRRPCYAGGSIENQ